MALECRGRETHTKNSKAEKKITQKIQFNKMNSMPSGKKPAKINAKMKKEAQTKYSPPTPLTAPPAPANPKMSTARNVLHIGGLQVEFPYSQPYGTQLAYMNRVISTLDRAQREGHCHALLESPTGTGKSLSLLCSTLAWQQNIKLTKGRGGVLPSENSRPNPEALSDPMNCGGGFIPESQTQSQQPLSGNVESVAGNDNKKKKLRLAPTIYYASRTHAQIRQVIQEYRRTTYRVQMAVLASRKHYCTNMYIRGTANVDEQCKLLLKEGGCSERRNVHKVRGHHSLHKGGCHEAHDIEDLVKVGEVVKGCSYFAARELAEDAELVFCPYNYIINPLIRRAMEIDIKGAIIILDEAHNIEDVARDAGSFDVEEDGLLQLQTELSQLALVEPDTYQPILEMIEDIFSWIDRRKSTLEKRDFQHYFSCWTGDKALIELEEANVTRKCFPILQKCAIKAIKDASEAEAEPEVACLSGVSATVLEGLFSSLSYFFSGDGLHVNDYLLALQRYIKKDGGSYEVSELMEGAKGSNKIGMTQRKLAWPLCKDDTEKGAWIYSFSLWCLNPAVVFRGIADTSLSVILTSGTLSPLNSFSSELGVQFGTCLEAPHVIDVESQLWAGVISKGPKDYPLNASYKTAEAFAFQDALGTSLEEICKIVPGGCLVFFPSYKLMDKLCKRWEETGEWSRLNAQKHLFIEPRGGNQDALTPVLNAYYNSIHQKNKSVIGRKRRGKNSDSYNITESSQNATREGAAFLAVCRGKISEGMDFSDDNARLVIIVGIPFPNVHDILVGQKKKFNDTFRLSKGLLSGNEWYCNQAFRALNQATGRCIRHRYDYGGILYLDERFCEERNRPYISKWFRKSIRHWDSFEKSLEDLKAFFKRAKDHVDKAIESSSISKPAVEGISSVTENKRNTNASIKNGKQCRSGQKVSNSSVEDENGSMVYRSLYSEMKNQSCPKMDPQRFISTQEKDMRIDLESDTEKDSGLSMPASTMLSPADPNLTTVKETPALISDSHLMTSEKFLIEDSSLTTVPSTNEVPDIFSQSPPQSLVNSSLAVMSICSLSTPERLVHDRMKNLIAETGSPCTLSANSYSHKRRKSLYPSSDCVHKEQIGLPDRTPDSVGYVESNTTQADMHSSEEIDTETINLNKEKRRSLQSSPFNGAEMLSTPSIDLSKDKWLGISCSECKTPLGLPHNLCIRCTLTSSSKVHLRSLRKKQLTNGIECSPSVPVLISDISFFDKRLFERNSDGVWCKADGCVFSTIFCPFCPDSTTCLGVQVMATDASNAYLQDKVLLYSDGLESKNPTSPKLEDSSPSTGSCRLKTAGLSPPIEKFAYLPQQQSLGDATTEERSANHSRKLMQTQEIPALAVYFTVHGSRGGFKFLEDLLDSSNSWDIWLTDDNDEAEDVRMISQVPCP
ncbi:OLC1v1016082C1 [Oldenlandia corymbosa var. corymbosa]|uniref:DNA 5'-3' helicase FANCJ n=1 Tax=Oldenlandia corymbosa var. corymbosa TaxID=529605 RepID=A0AAV1E4X1_OLDCO|nr:OLC1v1016082C1 [Oldenlandia corymbosa var. corymbosa]